MTQDKSQPKQVAVFAGYWVPEFGDYDRDGAMFYEGMEIFRMPDGGYASSWWLQDNHWRFVGTCALPPLSVPGVAG